MICQITWRVLNHANTDKSKLARSPVSGTHLAMMLRRFNFRPVGGPEWYSSNFHGEAYNVLTIKLRGGQKRSFWTSSERG